MLFDPLTSVREAYGSKESSMAGALFGKATKGVKGTGAKEVGVAG